MIFNEDIPKKIEPNLGREQYWIAIYGHPGIDNMWQLRVEGHHLSLNLTFDGNQLISSSPFLFGSWPAEIKDSDYRTGFQNLYWEEHLANLLIRFLGDVGFQGSKIPNPLPGESSEITFFDSGVAYSNLDTIQQKLIRRLVKEYLDFFPQEYVAKLDEYDISKSSVLWWGNVESRYAYIIENKVLRIEFQNIGNHIHCLVRIPEQE